MTITRNFALTTMAAASFALCGCGENGEDQSDASGGETTAQDVMDQTKDAAESAQDFAQGQVRDFRNTMSQRIDDVEQRISDLQARAEEMTGDAKERLQNTIDNLEERKNNFQQRLSEMQADSADAWDDVKSGIESAWNELDSAVDEAVNEFGQDEG